MMLIRLVRRGLVERELDEGQARRVFLNTRTRPNKREAPQVLAQRMWECRNGKFRFTKPAISFAAFEQQRQEEFLTVQCQLGRMKPSTQASRESVLATHIRPFFGLRLLREIDVALIREFVKTLIVKELSPKTISNVLG